MKFLRKLLKRLPKKYVKSLKKMYYKQQINLGTFKSQEKEFSFIDKIVNEGDKVIDIGANVGHYTLKLSKLVGKEGRVIAFEPIPETFELLSSNVGHAAAGNVTLINGAISTEVMEAKFKVPNGNLYQSYMDQSGDVNIMAFPLGYFLPENWKIAFIKIDAEGCDESIIRSAIAVLNNFRPVVMSEINQETAERLAAKMQNYSVFGVDGSHNRFIFPNEKFDTLYLKYKNA